MQESDRLELFSLLLFASFGAMALLLLALDVLFGGEDTEAVIKPVEIVEEQEPAVQRDQPQFASFVIES